ncbi:extracellular solute-binding protein [Herpetosiphon llansteffanensis]|uniref:extracellular solute-binding protein n=1 Tax=Herpetosiphon llansteffanensis TaxID=2094568 RepID=UPI000D7C6F44|nr:extracellular solute-binding protein [Herpetosiphon llansteffanensis]
MKRFMSFLLVSVMMVGLLAACGSATPTTAPTTAAATTAPTTAAEATAAPTAATTDATAEATAEATAAATTAPTTGGMVATGDITLWHAYSTGGSEDATLTTLIENAKTAFPDANITVLQVPFDQVFSKFENDVATGSGPDLFLAPNDSLGDLARKNLLADLDAYKANLTNIGPAGVAGMSVDGKLYGIPESYKAVALYYNKSTIATPPATTDELLQMVKDGKKLVLNQSAYHNFGFFQAFGASLFTADKACGLTNGGGDAFKYLQDLKAAGATFTTDGPSADAAFSEGKADMIINGPWVLADYQKALGENLAVAPMPAGPKGPAGPLTGVDGFYVNINSENVEGAVALAMYLTNTESQKLYTEQAGHVPADINVVPTDALVLGFSQAASTGYARPQDKELGNFWTPVGDGLTKALDGGEEATKAITDACAAMDLANGK